LAEWLGKALQKLLQQFESARDLGKQKAILKRGGFFYTKPAQPPNPLAQHPVEKGALDSGVADDRE
jgi:hypothetical protein